MQEIDNGKGVKLILAAYENIFNAAPIISYNQNFIEVPGVVIFSKKKPAKGIVSRLLNPGIEIIPIEEDLFIEMQEAIKVHESESSVISFESKTKPAKTTILNLELLKRSFVFARVDKDSISVNDMVFTNSEAEFHGDGMFTSKKVYFLNFENLAKIKNAIS
jgi:hypothetical protein